MKATVVIPNLDGGKFLRNCLEALCRQTETDFEVVIVDNGSTDHSVDLAMQYANRLKLSAICYDCNYGFAKAVNEGIRSAQSEYVVLLNNDTIPGRYMMEHLVHAMELPGNANVFSGQALMLQAADRSKVDSAGDYLNILGWARSIGRDRSAGAYLAKYRASRESTGRRASDYEEIFSSCAGAAIYRKSAFATVGFFDETYFAYIEDVDLGYRARLAGYRNILVPQARVLHVGSASSGSRHNAFKVRLAARNSLLTCYKNMSNAQLFVNAIPMCCGMAIKASYFASMGLGRAYLEGVLSAIGKFSDVERTNLSNVPRERIRKIQRQMTLLHF